MQRLGLLLGCGIILICSITSVAAQTTAPDTEDCKPGVAFTKISRSDISMSWNKTCFENATSYKIELYVTCDDDCPPNKNIQCGEELTTCQTSIQNMTWATYISPCKEVTMNISGNAVNKLLTTHLAPWFRSADWKLDDSAITTSPLHVKWGPPEDPRNDYVSCATNAMVTATCVGGDVPNVPVKGFSPNDTGSAELDIGKCTQGEVDVMVTYMSEVTYISEDPHMTDYVLTETNSNILRKYNPPAPPAKSGCGVGCIAGSVVGGVILLAGCVALGFYIKKRKS